MAFNEFNNDTTKYMLGAINTMLNTIGEPDLDTEDDVDEVLEAVMARKELMQVKREVLSDEWDINTDENVTISPDVDGYINLPVNILNVYSVDNDLIARSHYLYSKSAKSIRFSESKSITIVRDIMFNELPQAIRAYITLKATKRFRDRTLGADATQHGFTQEDERDAYMVARRSEATSTGANMLSTTFQIDRS